MSGLRYLSYSLLDDTVFLGVKRLLLFVPVWLFSHV